MAQSFDILFVADPRFTGGTSTGLASEMAAAAQSGYRCGLMMVKGPLLKLPHPIHPEIAGHIDAGRVVVASPYDPIEASIAIIHHPTIFQNLPARRLALATGNTVIVVPHPEVDAAGEVQYDLRATIANVRLVFGKVPVLAPVGPKVRQSLVPRSVEGCEIAREDWPYLIDLADWPQHDPGKTPGQPAIIGRHTRPDPAKWPDERAEALAVYPDSGDFEVRILGGGDFLSTMYGPLPENWTVHPFAHGGVSDFLRGLDFYVYYHSADWVEAFGRNILEALATGLVTILPPSFEPTFGDAAVYAEPSRVREIIEGFVADPERYRAQGQLARKRVGERHGFGLLRRRLEADFGVTPSPPPAAAQVISPAPVLFVSSNGVGLGHLTRQFAIARRLPETIRPLFLTMSLAFEMVLDQGFEGEFLPFHRSLGADPIRWNRRLAEEVLELLNFRRPRAVVFDGNVPYPGLLAALDRHPEIFRIWVRRGMWRPRHAEGLEEAARFDLTIEPGEIAAQFDHGPTVAVVDEVLQVAPILYLDPENALERAAARADLGIGEATIAVCLQLGSGNNYDFSEIRAALIDALLEHQQVEIVELRSPVQDTPGTSAATGRHRILETYPAAKYLRAFDLAVSAAGYNSFHENILAGLPTIFVPNEADEMDSQISRARYADLHGLGRLVRRQDIYDVRRIVADFVREDVLAAIRANCAKLSAINGADMAARTIAESVLYVRTDFDVSRADYPGLSDTR